MYKTQRMAGPIPVPELIRMPEGSWCVYLCPSKEDREKAARAVMTATTQQEGRVSLSNLVLVDADQGTMYGLRVTVQQPGREKRKPGRPKTN